MRIYKSLQTASPPPAKLEMIQDHGQIPELVLRVLLSLFLFSSPLPPAYKGVTEAYKGAKS